MDLSAYHATLLHLSVNVLQSTQHSYPSPQLAVVKLRQAPI